MKILIIKNESFLNFLKSINRVFLKLSKIYSRSKVEKQIKNILIANHKSFDRVLFVGSGGSLENLILSKIDRNKITTIDIDPNRKPDRVMSATDLHFPDNYFDSIFLLEVLEHIDDPVQAISELNRVLDNDGILVCTTPFVFGIHDAPYDYFRYTQFGLRYLFSDFHIISLDEREGPLTTVLIILSRLTIERTLFAKSLGVLFSIMFLPLLPVARFLDKYLSASVTSGYTLLASKK